MPVHKISKGLDLPITGAPKQELHEGPAVRRVAVLADDYPFMKPRMEAKVGDEVKVGQLLFEDRKSEGVRFTAPAAGTVEAIHRGEQRRLISVVIRVKEGAEEQVKLSRYKGQKVSALSEEDVRGLLVEAGLWTALRQRPYGKVPSPNEKCRSIFVTAMDSRPLSGDLDVILGGRGEELARGVEVLTRLTEGTVWFCRRAGSKLSPGESPRVKVEEFEGPHPSGLAGTHIHTLDPVGRERVVWYIGAQDVAAIGALFGSGRIDTARVLSLAGPAVKAPRLVKTRLGASLDELVSGELVGGECRVVSGSVLSGRKAQGEQEGYLGRYDQQVSCVAEDRERVFLGWLGPGLDQFSTVRAFLSGLMGGKRFSLTTTTNGSHRAMVPIGMYERVMPLDVMPTFLLRALLAGDLERAEQLGALELEEEDLGLCSFVSPGKEDYGEVLRARLTSIWKEG